MNEDVRLKLHRKEPHLGTWLSMGSPVPAELAALCGFDWVLFDLEHGCAGEGSLPSNLQAIRASGCAGIVRVGSHAPDTIMRVLDWGADGVMIPHVDSAAEARACVRAAHYAPRGTRGLSRSVRTYDYGLRSDIAGAPSPVILAQIESVAGVENAQAIAAVDGIDALFVGPADLNHDISARASKMEYEDCLKAVVAAADQSGKQSGILVRNRGQLPALRDAGFSFLAVDSDLAILRAAYLEILAAAGRGLSR